MLGWWEFLEGILEVLFLVWGFNPGGELRFLKGDIGESEEE